MISLLVSWKQEVSLRCSLKFLTLGRVFYHIKAPLLTLPAGEGGWIWDWLGFEGCSYGWLACSFRWFLETASVAGGNQLCGTDFVFWSFFFMVFCLRLWQFVRLGTLCLKRFLLQDSTTSRLVLPMTALLGGFLGVAIILSLRRHALKLVEIAKYQELQKQGDIQDAVSNLNVLQCLGSQTRRFAKWGRVGLDWIW